MERRKFTREFKLEAVRLIKDRGVSYVQASQDLGVHTSQLRDWVKKLADDPQLIKAAAFVCEFFIYGPSVPRTGPFSFLGTGRPQAIFLKADPHAGRPNAQR